MENQLKVGQSCEVAVITDNVHFTTLYKNGNTGIIENEWATSASICIGEKGGLFGTWAVFSGEYKKIGKLTITKVK